MNYCVILFIQPLKWKLTPLILQYPKTGLLDILVAQIFNLGLFWYLLLAAKCWTRKWHFRSYMQSILMAQNSKAHLILHELKSMLSLVLVIWGCVMWTDYLSVQAQINYIIAAHTSRHGPMAILRFMVSVIVNMSDN